MVQHQDALAVTGTCKGTSTNKIYEELGWESLFVRRWFHRLVQFLRYKMVSLLHILKHLFLLPEIIFMVPEVKMTSAVSNEELTHTYSFYPHTVKIWNEIGPGLGQAPSLIIFKFNTPKLNRPEKNNVSNIHDTKGIKRLFQLRVGLSPLRHKKRHNFKDTLSDICPCDTTIHFLIYCDLYPGVRIKMFQVINPILQCNDLNLLNDGSLVNFLLYGHETLSTKLNTAVLTATVNYIHKSTRFDPC